MYTVYILKSKRSGRYYKGQTNDMTRRLKEHNNSEEKSTATYVPWELVFSVEVPTRSAALLLEKKLKNMTGKEKIESFIERHMKKMEGGPDATSSM